MTVAKRVEINIRAPKQVFFLRMELSFRVYNYNESQRTITTHESQQTKHSEAMARALCHRAIQHVIAQDAVAIYGPMLKGNRRFMGHCSGIDSVELRNVSLEGGAFERAGRITCCETGEVLKKPARGIELLSHNCEASSLPRELAGREASNKRLNGILGCYKPRWASILTFWSRSDNMFRHVIITHLHYAYSFFCVFWCFQNS